jgi:hypothetical protein
MDALEYTALALASVTVLAGVVAVVVLVLHLIGG